MNKLTGRERVGGHRWIRSCRLRGFETNRSDYLTRRRRLVHGSRRGQVVRNNSIGNNSLNWQRVMEL